jgi:hypothetical protein
MSKKEQVKVKAKDRQEEEGRPGNKRGMRDKTFEEMPVWQKAIELAVKVNLNLRGA